MDKNLAFQRLLLGFLLLAANLGFGQALTSGGAGHALHICPDGSFMAWGENASGQLGNGLSIKSVVPAPLSISGNFTAVAAGLAHSLALRDDGTLWAWGGNAQGQLGTGNLNPSNLPVQVFALQGVTAIASYEEHALALLSDSSISAWGRNDHGQLGYNAQPNSSVALSVQGISTKVVAIATGRYFSMALDVNGKVWAWGDNGNGQLGIAQGGDSLLPLSVPGMEDSVVAIACGAHHALALKQDGSLWAWGSNSDGRLGIGNTNAVTGPQEVPLSHNMVSISAGESHSLACDSLGQVWAWGNNLNFQLGDSTTVPFNATPQRVATPHLAISVHAGQLSSMARLAGGNLYSWGENETAILGDGSFLDSNFPVKVLNLCENPQTSEDLPTTAVFRIPPGSSLRWKAGEIASSVALTSGKRVWFMGPSMLDSLRSDSTLPCNGNTVANWVLVQGSAGGPLTEALDAPRDATVGQDTAYFHDVSPHDTSFVPGAAYVLDTTIHVILSAFTGGSFAGTFHAKMGIGTVTLLDITKDNDSIIGIDVGKAVLIDSTNGLPYLYLYGTKRNGGLTSPIRPYLARRNLYAVPGIYEYKAKTGWSTSPADAYHISSHVVDSAFSVLAVDGRYALITQYVDPNDPSKSGNAMIALVSDSLWGPFGDERLLYVASDSFGPTPSSANTQPLLASGAMVHENCGDLLVSYNLDLPHPDDCDTIIGRLADTWRPKFLRIPLLQVDSQLQRGPVPDFSSTQIGNTVQFHSLGPAIQELIWDFGDGDFSILHDPVHTYLLPGNYIVTLQANCGTISQQSDTLQMAGNSLAMTAYPNPNSGSFTLEAWGLDSSEVTLRVMSLMGQVVFQRTYLPEVGRITQSFPTVEFLPLSGVYILQVLQGENSLERLIVVTH